MTAEQTVKDGTRINREAWLTSAVEPLSKMLAEHGGVVPDDLGVSCGWPGGRSLNKVIGQCWKSEVGDGRTQVFVSPRVNDPHDVLAVLLHELIHASDDCESGHKGEFRRLWAAVGFEGKPTTSVPGEELAERLAGVSERLGPYPHTGMRPGLQVKPQTTRQVKVECGSCGCIVRMTRKWLDEVGAPTCGCGTQMEEA